jgi:uracil-DNA glycosylase
MLRELELLRPTMQVVIALGAFAWASVWTSLRVLGYEVPSPRPVFGHLREVTIADELLVVGSYHPSQQNTFTGKLTEEMLDAVFQRAVDQAGR